MDAETKDTLEAIKILLTRLDERGRHQQAQLDQLQTDFRHITERVAQCEATVKQNTSYITTSRNFFLAVTSTIVGGVVLAIYGGLIK